MNPRPCSACHGSRAEVITETFTDNPSAFRRHAQLVEGGHAPSLCMRRDGTRNVCHLVEAPRRRPAAPPPAAAIPLPAWR